MKLLRSRLWLAAMAATLPLRQAFANEFFSGIHLNTNLSFGEHSITLNDDKINFSADQSATVEGDFCWDGSAKKLIYHNGTAEKTVAQADQVLALAGGTMSGALDMNSQAINNLPSPSGNANPATKAYVDAALAGTSGTTLVLYNGYIGNRSVSQINSLSPSAGWTVVATDAGTPTAGTSSLLAAGDLAQYNGTSWIKVVSHSSNFVPNNTKLVVLGSGTLYAPLTDGTDENSFASFDGTSNTPTLTQPTDGATYQVRGENATYEGSFYRFDLGSGAAADGVYTIFGGPGLLHSVLGNSSSGDDHTQYLKLAGRSGGQTQIGGTGAGDDLTFQSTSDATKGDIVLGQTGDTVKTGVDWVLTADINILPATNNTVTIGNGTYKLKSIRATTVTSGDHYFDGRHLGGGYFRLREGKAGLEMTPVDEDSQGNIFEVGETRKLVSVPKNPGRIRGAVLRALAIS